MGKFSRDKGGRGERELFGMLSADLGVTVRRNLAQTRGGGADTIEIAGWSVEVKRVENASVGAWFAQAQRQAANDGRAPVLFYRASYQPWRAVFDCHDLNPGTFPEPDRHIATLDYAGAVQVIRESLSDGGA